MASNQDQSMQTRLFSINLATSDPSRITGFASLQAAVEFGRKESIQAEEDLLQAVKIVSQDKQENKAATQIVDDTLQSAVEEYVVLGRQVKVDVVPVRQKDIEAMGPKEFNSRTEFVEVNFSLPPSALLKTGRHKILNHLTNVVQSCVQSDYVSNEALAPLAAKVAAATQAVNALKDEELDDEPLLQKLYQARENATRTYQAFRGLVQSALLFSQSPNTIDQFILNEVKKKAPEKSQEVETALAEDEAADEAAETAAVPTVAATVTP